MQCEGENDSNNRTIGRPIFGILQMALHFSLYRYLEEGPRTARQKSLHKMPHDTHPQGLLCFSPPIIFAHGYNLSIVNMTVVENLLCSST